MIGKNVTTVQSDVSQQDDLDCLYGTVKKEKGILHIVVGNAGITELAPPSTATPEFYTKFYHFARGTFFTIQKAVPLMTAGGAIVTVAAVKDRATGKCELDVASTSCAPDGPLFPGRGSLPGTARPFERGLCRPGRGRKAPLEEIPAGRGFPIDHFTCQKNAGEFLEHQPGIEFAPADSASG